MTTDIQLGYTNKCVTLAEEQPPGISSPNLWDKVVNHRTTTGEYSEKDFYRKKKCQCILYG